MHRYFTVSCTAWICLPSTASASASCSAASAPSTVSVATAACPGSCSRCFSWRSLSTLPFASGSPFSGSAPNASRSSTISILFHDAAKKSAVLPCPSFASGSLPATNASRTSSILSLVHRSFSNQTAFPSSSDSSDSSSSTTSIGASPSPCALELPPHSPTTWPSRHGAPQLEFDALLRPRQRLHLKRFPPAPPASCGRFP
mmetsp:Transcript_18078/g.40495  ORF Transcript_18078/g.40495 Transcript_18078/m.40495 type:complete len:201 (-) Transcript_18078:569-1171(-)